MYGTTFISCLDTKIVDVYMYTVYLKREFSVKSSTIMSIWQQSLKSSNIRDRAIYVCFVFLVTDSCRLSLKIINLVVHAGLF